MNRMLLAIAVAALAMAGCSTGSASTCGPIRHEALDPRSLQHTLPGAPTPSYPSAAPTSGPHQPGPALGGRVLTAPISPPLQVGALEAGDVLLQYRDLPAAALDRLVTLASPHVVVAPNPKLADPVVATAWQYRRSCSAVDLEALRRFIGQRVGKGADASH